MSAPRVSDGRTCAMAKAGATGPTRRGSINPGRSWRVSDRPGPTSMPTSGTGIRRPGPFGVGKGIPNTGHGWPYLARRGRRRAAIPPTPLPSHAPVRPGRPATRSGLQSGLQTHPRR